MNHSLFLGLTIGGTVIGVLFLFLIFLAIRSQMRPFFISHKRTKFTWEVQEGRRAALGHNGMAVFLIGMRINKWYRVDLWLPPLMAMGKMLRELQEHDVKLGYYGGETYGMIAMAFGYPSLQVTYWESVEKVISFSSGTIHKDSMRNYMKAMQRARGAVGVWHELFEIGKVEGMHRDMPEFGLVRAVGSINAEGALTTSIGRLKACPGSRTSAFNCIIPNEIRANPPPEMKCPYMQVQQEKQLQTAAVV